MRTVDWEHWQPWHSERIGYDCAVHGFGDKHFASEYLGDNPFDRCARVDQTNSG
jgi:hypothetical protein